MIKQYPSGKDDGNERRNKEGRTKDKAVKELGRVRVRFASVTACIL